MKALYVVNCCRTAIGKFGGALKNTTSADLGAVVINEVLARANVSPEQVSEVMLGCVLTAALGQNVARQAALKAGIPPEVPAYTANMVCGSGMKSIIEGARSILIGDADIVVVGGTENMSMAPYAMCDTRFGARMGNTKIIDTLISDSLIDAFYNCHMGITAENICEQWHISREDMDAFAFSSQIKALAAQYGNRFDPEIVPVLVNGTHELLEFKKDECPKNDIMAMGLATLSPAFQSEGGCVTFGNSANISDGAAAILLASEDAVRAYHLTPMARLIGWGQAGVDPAIMGIASVPATRQALKKAGLHIGAMDLVEVNEAFAAQPIAMARELHLDLSSVNVNGGAIALGHPVGASGARIIVTLLHELHKRKHAKRGLATLCIGGGMGIATIFEKC